MLHIRNFSIIAHIDHGKSTLADRPIQHTELVDQRQFHDQIRDTMIIKRERGIATKSQKSVSLPYTCRQRETFELDLIDTAGNVDFSYEVSRALASCEGVLLIAQYEGDSGAIPPLNEMSPRRFTDGRLSYISRSVKLWESTGRAGGLPTIIIMVFYTR